MTTGPVEQLTDINAKILRAQVRLGRLRVSRRLAWAAGCIGAPTAFALFILNNSLTHNQALKFMNLGGAALIALAIAAGVGSFAIYAHDDTKNPDGPDRYELEISLSVLLERKRLQASNLAFDLTTKQAIYKYDITPEVENLRADSKRYRRIHNTLQSVIIIGSLSTATLTSLTIQAPTGLGLASVASSFLVGISAGFTGYFKFRERSFYQQQTADAIEQEKNAVELGIGRYKEIPEESMMAIFIEEVERLKAEQHKREQNLEQPPEGAPKDQS